VYSEKRRSRAEDKGSSTFKALGQKKMELGKNVKFS
jgi:hypothetical protein